MEARSMIRNTFKIVRAYEDAFPTRKDRVPAHAPLLLIEWRDAQEQTFYEP